MNKEITTSVPCFPGKGRMTLKTQRSLKTEYEHFTWHLSCETSKTPCLHRRKLKLPEEVC